MFQGLQLRARARTWRMCRQTESEPGEEKPKWIHSLSWMEEERRREGDVRASFNCLCPVKSAQTPGAAPGSGVRADFRAELPIKPRSAATLLWHRHVSSCSTTLTFTVFPPSSPVTFKMIWKCSSHLRPAALSSTALSSGTRVRVWARLKLRGRASPAKRCAEALPVRGLPLPRVLLSRGAPGWAWSRAGTAPRSRGAFQTGPLFWRFPAGRAAERRAGPGRARQRATGAKPPRRSQRCSEGFPGRALRGSGRGGARGAERPRAGVPRALRSLPPPVGAGRPLRPSPAEKGGRPRGAPAQPEPGDTAGTGGAAPGRAPAARGPRPGRSIINHQYL